MKIHDVPHGLNVVVETGDARVIIGRFDSISGQKVLLHHCDVRSFEAGEDPEPYIRETATYGVEVKQRDVVLDVDGIARVRVLGEIPKVV